MRSLTLITVLLLAAGCGPESSSDNPSLQAAAPRPEARQPAVHPEQQLIEDLVLASRMLASEEVGVLDTSGHVSVRSRINPNHYYISRYVSPGIVTIGDIIENDLDSSPVDGPRFDEYQEVHIHGEIYKARPDVMAVVHGHPSELVAFSVSSLPLYYDDVIIPVWDARDHNDGRFSIVNSPELGASMAETLGSGNAVLLLGHGIVVASNSLLSVVRDAYRVRNAARLEQMMIEMGGTWDPNPRRISEADRVPETPAVRPVVMPTSDDGARGAGRDWAYWRRLILEENGGVVPANPPAATARDATRIQALKQDLALASRILASREVGVLDAYGHVSVRHPDDPNRYFIPRYISAGIVTTDDIIENDLDSQPVDGPRDDEFQEIYLHGEIYKARPDVMAIVHAHTPELLAFTQSSVTLRPVVNQGRFIGHGLPMFDIRRFDPRARIINTPRLGQLVAETLADRPAVLLTGHGFALTDSSLYGLVGRAYGLRKNAQIQQMAMALGGEISYLDGPLEAAAASRSPIVPTGDGGAPGGARMWEYWRQIISVN